MGCCSSTLHYDNTSMKLQSKCGEVLLYLKAVAMRMIELGQYAMAIQVIHIRNITKSYYSTVNSQRTKAIRNYDRMCDEESESLEKRIVLEEQTLEKTLNSVKYNFYSIYNDFVFIRPSVDTFVYDFKNKSSKVEDYKELKAKCIRYVSNGKGIDCIVKILNNEQEFSRKDKQFIKSLCEYTSYLANDKRKRISYNSFVLEQRVREKTDFLDYCDRNALNKIDTEKSMDESLVTANESKVYPKIRSKSAFISINYKRK